jgi:hypothetical protein
MTPRDPSVNRLAKKAKRGFRGYPLATIAFYGPTNELASKVAVAIILKADAEPVAIQRWFGNGPDVRMDPIIAAAILTMLAEHKALTVVMTRGIIGCPHEEGIDYPEGTPCPACPFWKDRDRWKDV